MLKALDIAEPLKNVDFFLMSSDEKIIQNEKFFLKEYKCVKIRNLSIARNYKNNSFKETGETSV